MATPKLSIKALTANLEIQELNPKFCYHFTNCFGYTILCGYCSFQHTIICPERSVLCRIPSACPAGSIDPTTWQEGTIYEEIIPYLDIHELDELKKGLQVLSEKIDKEFKPAKAKQLDTLETALNATLKEVQDLKKKTK
jgi:hypothetical protein